jgi:hypothetical protein
MKKLFVLSVFVIAAATIASGQEDKSKRPSPPAIEKETLSTGTNVTIDYSQPALKGRAIGKEVAPYGKVWRTGANEPTTIEISKDVKVEGQDLPAGKYSLWTIPGENEWVVIFNKKTTGWGTQYDESQDLLRVKVKPTKSNKSTERMTFDVSKNGQVALLWGNEQVNFHLK